MTPTYKEDYTVKLLDPLKKALGTSNIHQLPKLEKIIVSEGIGSYMQKNKDYALLAKNLEQVTGQKCIVKNSKKAISNFKLRAGMPVSLMVTLRGNKMHAFVSKLVNVIFPRVRDFRGLSRKSFDGHGNYSVGLKEQTVFPEVKQDDSLILHGVQVTFATTAKNNEEGTALLEAIGMPFQKKPTITS